MSHNKGVFAGLKVIDCASYIAGPAAATILSDFGADVVKVEPTGIGDPYRYLYRLEGNPSSQKNYFWNLTSRNKRSLAVNLKTPAGTEIISKLIKEADVFIINFPPHVRKGLGLTYEDVSRINPKIIYADVTGYGDHGPEADKPGFDETAYWARTGFLDFVRMTGSPPPFAPSGTGDHATASTLYGGIVTALYRREKTGAGSHVTTSLVGSGAWAVAGWLQAALDGAKPARVQDRTNPVNALVNSYRTQDDRWLMLCFVQEDREWPGLVQTINRPELLTDVRFANGKARRENAKVLTLTLEESFATKPLSYWREMLDKLRLTFGVFQTIDELASDEQLILNGNIREVKGETTKSFTVDSPIYIEGEEKVQPGSAPGLGEHSYEILSELGYNASEIDDLSRGGIISQPQKAA
jgi:crotonobetainyl-CoA:carnitine CoA-transferase CaiB-like acyl-CoA transferase